MKQNNIPISALPPFLQNDLDFATLNLKVCFFGNLFAEVLQEPKDNSPTFVPQSSTKTHFSAGNLTFPPVSMI